jgi:hypothetical protein
MIQIETMSTNLGLYAAPISKLVQTVYAGCEVLDSCKKGCLPSKLLADKEFQCQVQVVNWLVQSLSSAFTQKTQTTMLSHWHAFILFNTCTITDQAYSSAIKLLSGFSIVNQISFRYLQGQINWLFTCTCMLITFQMHQFLRFQKFLRAILCTFTVNSILVKCKYLLTCTCSKIVKCMLTLTPTVHNMIYYPVY